MKRKFILLSLSAVIISGCEGGFSGLIFPKTQPLSPEAREQLRKDLQYQQFQQNIQKQNNKNMKEMLKNTSPKTKR